MAGLTTVDPPLQPELAGAPWARVLMTGRACGDMSLHGDPDAARSRRGDALARLDARLDDAVFAGQVHGARVARVGAGERGRGARDPADPIGDADALLTTEARLALCIQTADCVPVALAATGQAAGVAAVHAGRRGVVAGVVGAAVAALAEVTGAAAGEVTAAVGPAIGGCCYEVPTEMATETRAIVPEARATTRWDTPGLDLPAAVWAQLRASGVRQVTAAGTCTRCDDARWFSHRAWQAGEGPAGRQLLAVLAASPAGSEPATSLHSRV